ncbi:hypothetical protein F2Q69_00024287 [Brassica cretica]|uniref:Uncharacterized protein n=1 Tax=Brassica cretica TaxID=69181 RepID=A0A8S9QF51_BRACR|nr:hypothetical protein F2Q69_00024287 [Brassica cretica]
MIIVFDFAVILVISLASLDMRRFLSVTETQSRFLKALKENEDLGAGNGGLGLAFTLLT